LKKICFCNAHKSEEKDLESVKKRKIIIQKRGKKLPENQQENNNKLKLNFQKLNIDKLCLWANFTKFSNIICATFIGGRNF